MIDEIQTASIEPKVSMVIEDNNYAPSGRFWDYSYILDFGDGLDLENSLGTNSPYYYDVKDLFVGYDEIVIIDHVRENPDPTFDEPLTTYMFLTKEPLEYETFRGEFYYDMIGITVTITEKTGSEDITEKDPHSVYKEITKDGLTGIGTEMYKAKGIDGTEFDLPTTLVFVDSQNAVTIKGFLTLDQASALAKTLMR